MTVLTIGRKLVPLAQVAFVEVFDPAANPEFKPEKEFKARLILLNREIGLAPEQKIIRTRQQLQANSPETGMPKEQSPL